MIIDQDLIFTDLRFDTAEQAILFGAEQLRRKGCVKDGYAASVAAREKQFPTGLPTEPIGIAIPHTNSDMVNHSAICLMKMARPVEFRQMGDEETRVFASVVILLAVAGGQEHMELLSGLMELFSDDALLKMLGEARCPQDVIRVLTGFGGFAVN
ncbi:MAG: PTS sugar transporter subunit IIA [Candidatus Pelethousia sp.]|nr:PTS sugar transporter subunit IIA [Candidatus Pelethousia sp.]